MGEAGGDGCSVGQGSVRAAPRVKVKTSATPRKRRIATGSG